MTRIIIESDFKTLREAYLNIKAFVAKEVGEDEILIKSKIVDDLGCAGDDNWELIQKFIAKYNLDNTGYDFWGPLKLVLSWQILLTRSNIN